MGRVWRGLAPGDSWESQLGGARQGQGQRPGRMRGHSGGLSSSKSKSPRSSAWPEDHGEQTALLRAVADDKSKFWFFFSLTGLLPAWQRREGGCGEPACCWDRWELHCVSASAQSEVGFFLSSRQFIIHFRWFSGFVAGRSMPHALCDRSCSGKQTAA